MRYNLAYVINNLNVGGAEKLLLSTVTKLDKEKYDVIVFSMLAGDQLLQDFKDCGIKVVCLGMKHKRDLSGFWKLYRSFKSKKIQIVHTHLLEADIFGRFAALLAKVPVVISTEHSLNEWKKNPTKLKSKLRLLLDQIAANRSNAIVAISDKIKDHLVRYEKIDPTKIYVIKNGIEIKDNNSDISSKKENAVVIGSVGRLYEEKGYKYLLKAMKEIKSTVPNVKLLIAGDGPLRLSLEKLSADLEISDCISFAGIIHDINTFLKNIDIFVLASIREGIPLALLEAMMMGKPVIATSVGGIPEVVDDGVNGLLVNSANVPELEEAIISLAHNQAKRIEMGKNARAKVLKNFNIDKTVEKISLLYEELLNNLN